MSSLTAISIIGIMRHLADFTKVDLNTNAPQQQCSTLLTLLPPEIRERIYTYTLQDTIIPSTMHLYPLSKRRHGLPKPPPLCVCCKQLYLESIKLHWSHSIFLFPTSTNLNAFNLWFTNIGRRRRELISNIYIQKSGLGYNKDRKRQERRDLKENAETGRCWLEKFWELMIMVDDRG
ncbi:hypothetical protein HII31_11121 [Pseudocercospora fuligena]|uniref:Uncharacterized protein n=1 Tax=Pseudocercospora fuligena TaxID=685502 RepID=A0A8H6VEG5_9PEZI|nr:hypothetical protein HII31_11121 [Pseudocercospora fuligena]